MTVLGQHVGLRVGEVSRGDSPRAFGIAEFDGIGKRGVRLQHCLTLGRRRIVAGGRATFGPALFVAGPQRLEAADHGRHRGISAAMHHGVMKLATEIGEKCSVIEVFGHRGVESLQLAARSS